MSETNNETRFRARGSQQIDVTGFVAPEITPNVSLLCVILVNVVILYSENYRFYYGSFLCRKVSFGV